MDSAVDKSYKQKYFQSNGKRKVVHKVGDTSDGTSEDDEDYAKPLQVTHDYIPSSAVETFNPAMGALMESLDDLNIEPETKTEPCYLSRLPEEIQTLIASHLLDSLPGTSTFLNTWPIVCRKFLTLAATHSLWNTLCLRDIPKTFLPTDIQTDWQKVFIEQPRLRFDGVYISTCNYIRPGLSEASWNNPIWVVTYFRFLRFYKDGTCLSCLTTNEPKEVVHDLRWAQKADSRDVVISHSRNLALEEERKLKGLSRGTWTATQTGEVSIQIKGHRVYVFLLELQVCDCSKHKLVLSE